MDRPTIDRNLLFGIIALQNDLIAAEALRGAVREWAAGGGRPLGQVLRDRGSIDDDTRELVGALVEVQLGRHGGDPGRSLRGIGSIGSIIEELGRVAAGGRPDPAGPGPVDDRNPPATRAPDPYATRDPGEAVDPAATQAGPGTRFRILRPHAKGGIGEVFVASDGELNREVALKEIQDHHADHPTSRARFLLEAEITGGLEHPGIVPIYGLGQYVDGRPYYAMRFIRGESFQEAIREFHRRDVAGRDPGERTLELRKLLGRFIDACDAIAYAHSRSILHRDIKPGNIMLGPYGETLVVDWGLAKPFGGVEVPAGPGDKALLPASMGSAEGTVAGQAVGTPAFMSPEQAAGDLDRLGPPSDIYSLGATLYVLLTGKVPFAGRDLFEVLDAATRGDFPPPREAGRLVPPALDAVCSRAMALRPEDRYGSPRDLAEDLEHWLADEPVSAYREPPLDRARRWARRHKPLVAGAGAMAAAGVAALAAIAAIVLVKNGQIRREQQATEVQRDVAEGRFDRAFRAVSDFQGRVDEESGQLNRAGLDHLRQALSEDSLNYFRDFLKEKADDPRVRAEVAAAHYHLGRSRETSGSKDDAAREYALAASLFERLAEDRPAEVRYRRELGRAHTRLAAVQLQLTGADRRAAARESLRVAIDLQSKLVADHPDRPELRDDLAQSDNELGLWYHKGGGMEAEALRACREGLEIRRRRLEAHPSDIRLADELAKSTINYAVLLVEGRRIDEGYRSFLRARDLLMPLVARFDEARSGRVALATPASEADVRNRLAQANHYLGTVGRLLRKPDESRDAYDRAIRDRERLVALSTVTEYQRDLAKDYHDLGDLQSEVGVDRGDRAPLDRALGSYRQALEIRERLVLHHGSVKQYRRDLVVSLFSIGRLQGELGRIEDGLACYDRARGIMEALVRENPEEGQLRRDLAEGFEKAGALQFEAGRFEPSAAAHRRAIAILEGVAAADGRARESVAALSFSYNSLGMAQYALGRPEDALVSYREAVDIWRRIVREAPDEVGAVELLAACLKNLAIVSSVTGRGREAAGAYRESIGHRRRVLSKPAEDPDSRRSIAADCVLLGLLEREVGRPAESGEALAIARDLWRGEPAGLVGAARDLAVGAARVGGGGDDATAERRLERQRYLDGAMEALRQAVALGLRGADPIEKEPAFDPLRSRDDYGPLLERLKLGPAPAAGPG